MSTKTLKVRSKKKTELSERKEVIVEAIQDKKGEETVSLDLRKTGDAVTDIFVICHATAKVQVKAIADNVERKMKMEFGENPWHSEGLEHLEWVILDYIDVVVHIFLREKREFYQLEELWQDAERTDYD